MMDFSAGAAIWAGLVATAVMSAVLYMGIAMMPKQMTMNMLYMLGTMMTRSKTPAYLVGGMMHPMVRSGEMMAPGVFVKNHTPLTVMGFLMLHLIYGLVVGLLYEAWV